MPSGDSSKEVSLTPNQSLGTNERICGDCELHDKEEKGFQYGIVKFWLERRPKMIEQAYAKLLSPFFHLSHMHNVGKPPHISILQSKFLLELGLIPVHVSEFYDLGDDLSLEDWRLKWETKVKSNGKLVLGYLMARKKSRVSIELGVQVRI
ncbi:hypothetical protein PIB30_105063 [Stylosanthes scabra]|uniref:Uncharacterized protein n=1 Tax=Stylosanthes scabra TaxID=79078 RepID=A0ABU6YW71_9FABA|nr:hypothetical protein [Stylosanthes scabra]